MWLCILLRNTFMDMTMTPVAIALLNTVFRLATVIVLFPFIPKIEKLVCWLVKDNKEDLEDEADFDLLEERLLNYPALAIAQCHRVMNGMSKKLRKNVNRAMNLLNDYQQDKYDKVQRKEDLIDKYESRLGEYLIQLTKLQIHEPASFSRSIFYNIQILRRKKHQINYSEKLTGLPDRKTIDRNAFCFILFKMHINPVGKLISFYHHPDMRFILSKLNHILISASFMRFCSSAKIKCLQDIGLSLSVIAVKYIRPLCQIEFQRIIISEIF